MSGIDDCCPDCGGSLAECHIGDAVCPGCGAIVEEPMVDCVPDNQREMDYSPHFITMTFDMTDFDGQVAFENARQGLDRGLVLWKLDWEMRDSLKHGTSPRDVITSPDGACYAETYDSGIVAATKHWRKRLHDLMDEHDVTEVE